MKELTIKLTHLFSFENMFLKTKEFFYAILFKQVKPEAPVITTKKSQKKSLSVGSHFELMAKNNLIVFAKNVNYMMRVNCNYPEAINLLLVLDVAISEYQIALAMGNIDVHHPDFLFVKSKRWRVVTTLQQLANVVTTAAKLDNNNAKLIIERAGFEVK